MKRSAEDTSQLPLRNEQWYALVRQGDKSETYGIRLGLANMLSTFVAALTNVRRHVTLRAEIDPEFNAAYPDSLLSQLKLGDSQFNVTLVGMQFGGRTVRVELSLEEHAIDFGDGGPALQPEQYALVVLIQTPSLDVEFPYALTTVNTK